MLKLMLLVEVSKKKRFWVQRVTVGCGVRPVGDITKFVSAYAVRHKARRDFAAVAAAVLTVRSY